MAEAAGDENLLVTDLADVLVRQGLPFNQAHELAGKSLGEEPLAADEQELVDAAWSVLNIHAALSARAHQGASGGPSVERQIARARELL